MNESPSFSSTKYKAFYLLKGPESIEVTPDFWGEPLICFSKNLLPFTQGMVESKVIYGNLSDSDQSYCLVRSTTWDAKISYQYFQEQTEVNPLSIIDVHYYLVSKEQVHHIFNNFKFLTIPLIESTPSVWLEPQFTLELNWKSRTQFKISWNSTCQIFSDLTNIFAQSWRELNLLPVFEREIKENWHINVAQFISK